MLTTLQKYLPILAIKGGRSEVQAVPHPVALSDGFHLPQSADQLLQSAQRGKWLHILWDYSSLPKEMYQLYYLHPLERCISLMQQFPATESGHHAYLGGMVDHLLETVAYAARLSKNYLLPVGEPPEEQASQGAAWNAVIVYAAMLQALDGLSQIDVELESGRRWLPLDAMPREPYRFRFLSVADPLQIQSMSAMLAWKIIPSQALVWLSAWPDVLKTLSLYLTGFRHESGIIHTIVLEAIRASIGKSPPVTVVTPVLSAVQEATLPNEASSSALENSTVDIEPAHQVDDMTSDLLEVMGFSDSGDSSGECIPLDIVVENIIKSDQLDIGKRFWQWLSDGCCSGRFEVNTPHARVHIIAGYVFIRTPNIFHQFLSENPLNSVNKTDLQNAFERLGRHRRDNGVMYTCHIYQNEAQEGQFCKMTGYLIIAKSLYKGHNIPGVNPFLKIKS
ncbi:relaxase [Serratia sp. S1B]|nr:relaxase [Serratia sp. S1B]